MSAPFIGPAPLSKDQQLFGRDTEVEELSWRTVADRIVVLYSPSGAGKTSLLMATACSRTWVGVSTFHPSCAYPARRSKPWRSGS